MRDSRITRYEKSCRPNVTIRPSSVTTVLFKKLESRDISEMKSEPVHFEKIEDQKVTSSSFGTAYKLSGKSVNFKNGSPLISNNTSNKGSYLKLTERFNKMVFDVKTLSSSYLYSSANTTLYYINNNGEINSYNYGDIQFEKRENFKLILDISPETLTDGCQGILSITNGNWSSELTFALNDVYFLIDNEKSFRFYEKYSDSDSNLLDCLENNSYTSLDFTEAEGLSGNENWNNIAENKNCIFYVSEQSDNKNPNVVNGSRCNQLTLIDNGGNLYFKNEFTAENASIECNLEGYRL